MRSDTTPTVTSNGTSRQALKDERMNAIRALHAAGAALENVTVNGRDYIGEDARFAVALAAHEARLVAIKRAIDELTNEVIDLR